MISWVVSVKEPIDAPHSQGHLSLVWDGTDNMGVPVASGMYFIRMIAKVGSQSTIKSEPIMVIRLL